MKNTKTENPFLSKTQLLFLRLYLHNESMDSICYFLNTNLAELEEIQKDIYRKFFLNDLRDIVQKAFKMKILNPIDYTENAVKDHAMLSSEKIITTIITKNINGGKILNSCKKLVQEYFMICDESLYENDTKVAELERKIIKNRYLGISSTEIVKQLSISPRKLNLIENRIFTITKVNGWYNLYGKLFFWNILQREEYSSLSLEQQVNATAATIKKIVTNQYHSYKEKKLKIYLELVNLFNIIEYDYLFINK